MIKILDESKIIELKFADPLLISTDREVIIALATYPREAEDYIFTSKPCDVQIDDTIFYGCEFDNKKKAYSEYYLKDTSDPLRMIIRFTFDHTNGKGWVV